MLMKFKIGEISAEHRIRVKQRDRGGEICKRIESRKGDIKY